MVRINATSCKFKQSPSTHACILPLMGNIPWVHRAGLHVRAHADSQLQQPACGGGCGNVQQPRAPALHPGDHRRRQQECARPDIPGDRTCGVSRMLSCSLRFTYSVFRNVDCSASTEQCPTTGQHAAEAHVDVRPPERMCHKCWLVRRDCVCFHSPMPCQASSLTHM